MISFILYVNINKNISILTCFVKSNYKLKNKYMIYYIILSLLFIVILIFFLFIYSLKRKIDRFEKKIIKQFKEKNNQIPSIYEATKEYLNKHDEVFKEIIKLKKKDFLENIFYNSLIEKLNNYNLIHNELNFIFRICNKNPELSKDSKFLYIKDIIIMKSSKLWNDLELYKKVLSKYNKMIYIKNLTIIWLLIPLHKKN